MGTSSDIRDEEQYRIFDYDGHDEKLLQLLYQKGIGGIQRYSFNLKNKTVYFQIHLCCRQMDQTESTMEAPTLHRPTVRSAVLILKSAR